MNTVDILVPAYNEEGVIDLFYDRVCSIINQRDCEFRFLFINDGSNDNTLNEIKALREKDPRVAYIDFSRNFGKEVAMAAGFDHVDADAVLVIDADLQDPPELIPRMIQLLEQGYDDVYGQRASREGETFLKKFSSSMFYRLLEKFSRVPIQKDTGDFRLLSRRAANAMQTFTETERYTKGLFSLLGFKKKAILYKREARVAGKTKWNYFKLMVLAIEGISSFSTAPLRLATILGIKLFILSILYMIYIISKTIIYGDDVAGYPSLICFVLFIGGVQLLCLGIVGEYLGRVFCESKGRPLYFVMDSSGVENTKKLSS
ncbi:MAG: glycosyltransferase family 2 protein [Lentisphaeraceae bacterium]|nr:glycosyltransferase family 2 protein [Lentisphaeraceae bacterium]